MTYNIRIYWLEDETLRWLRENEIPVRIFEKFDGGLPPLVCWSWLANRGLISFSKLPCAERGDDVHGQALEKKVHLLDARRR